MHVASYCKVFTNNMFFPVNGSFASEGGSSSLLVYDNHLPSFSVKVFGQQVF
jgi:hypothetical protein